MIRVLVQKELRTIVRDGRFPVLALVALALLAIVLVVSAQAQEGRAREKAQTEALVRAQWDHQGDKHPHRGAHFGLYAFRPVGAAEWMDPGIGAHVGQALWLEPHRRNLPRSQPAADALPSSRFGELTPAFVLVGLFPLLIIAFGFNAITQERESGSLRMLHGAGVQPSRLLWGKLLTLVLLFGGLAVLPLALAPSLQPLAMPGGGGWRVATLAGCLLVYYGCISAIVLAASTWCRSSATALHLLLALWLGFTFVAPRAGAAAARELVPLPTAGSFWGGIQADYTHGLPGDGDLAARSKRFDAELLERHGVQRVEDLPVGAAPLRRLQRDVYADRVHELHFARLWKRLELQEWVVRTASLASPVLAMRNVSMKLAGTDLAHQRHFEAAAERYRRQVNRQIDTWDADHTRGLTSFESKYANNALWQSVDGFAYAPPPLAFALQQALPDLAILGLWGIASMLLLGAAARRLAP